MSSVAVPSRRLLVVGLFLSLHACAAETRLEYRNGAIEARGLPRSIVEMFREEAVSADAWRHLLSLHVDDETLPAVAGSYALDEHGVVRFEPAFALRPGVRYVAILRPSALPGRKDQEPRRLVIELPAPDRPPSAEVVAIYPSGPEVPRNVLRFIVHFSAPMSRGAAYSSVHLLDERGRVVADAFLELEEELWDPDARRLTLLLDPGRIKSDLVPSRELGTALVAGRTYELLVDETFPDAAGQPLRAAARHRFRVTEADRTSPDPAAWLLTVPPAGGGDSLTVDLDEPLDHSLLLDRLTVEAHVAEPSGRSAWLPVAGRVTISKHEQRWQFVPATPWRDAEHRLRIDPWLEDRAGNRIGRLFERVLVADEAESEPPSARWIAFRPRGPAPPRQTRQAPP